MHVPKGIKDVLGNQAVWEEICQVRWPSPKGTDGSKDSVAGRVNGEVTRRDPFRSIVRWSSSHTGRGVSFVWYVQAVWRVTVQADSVGQPALMNGKPFPSSSGMDYVQAGFETRMCGVCIGGGV